MSGAANQGAYGNPGMGPSPSPSSSPWGSPWNRSAGSSGGAGAQGSGPWGGDNGWGPPPWAPPWAGRLGTAFPFLGPFSRPLLLAATIIGFMIWWPVGVVMLCLALWNRRMSRFAFGRGFAGAPDGATGWGATGGGATGWSCGGWSGRSRRNPASSGNRAFDDYRDETLRRLEEEQKEFASFLDRLRFAKDKSEFDQFMADRRQSPPPQPPAPPAEPRPES